MMKRNDLHVSRLSVKLFLLLALLLSSSGGLQAKATDTDTLRVLAIGNSFSQDAVEQYLHELGKSEGYIMIIGNMYIGGCSLERHVKNIRNNTPAYAYRKVDKNGERVEIRETTIEKALADEPWDYVSLQQASPVSGIYETYKASLPELVNYVKPRVGKKTVLMMHQTWAYASNSTHSGFKNYNSSQMKMYTDIVDAVKEAAGLVGIKKIIPSGTAIQNARTTFIGDHMNRDGYHLDLKIGRYTAACTWFEALTGQNVIGAPYSPKGMNYDEKEVAQKAAHAAILCPDKVTHLFDLKQPAAKANYNEANVPEYTLPDALTLKNGKPVTTAEQWMKKRRPELLRLFETEMFGRAPKHPKDMHFEVLTEDNHALGGLATRKEVNVYLTKDNKKYFTILMYIPNQRAGTVPLFFGLNFKGNHTISTDPGISYPTPEKQKEFRWKKLPERGVASARWPIETIMKNGYALATIYRGDIDPDFDDAFKNGVHPLFYKKGQRRPADNEWGTIAAWAWAMSCAMDYFETGKEIDASKVAVFGHSRHGKAALWAGATDQRFSLIISNCSGCGGAALSRRAFGETVRAVNRQFTHWFCRNFWKYNDKEENLPFDQHELIALQAPRPVYIASATEDRWADPKGEFLSGVYATPVYELFGKKGLESAEMPATDTPVRDGSIAYHIRTGIHNITVYDWEQYIKFADKWFKGK